MFNNYKIVVTGVSGILGEKAAKAFLDRGAFVIGIDQKEPSVESDRFIFLQHCFLNDSETDSVCSKIENCFNGAMDTVVNAAPMDGNVDLRKISKKEFDEYLCQKLYSVIDINRKLCPMLKKSESGNPSIVNIGSSESRSNNIASGMKSLCSQALIKLTRIQAGSYDGIRCNSVSPADGKDNTELQSVIDTVLFLCSEDAGFITGADFLVDYGVSARNGARLES